MFVEAVFSYIYDKRFIYQSLATLSTFIAINIIKFAQVRKRRFELIKHYNIKGPEPRLIDGNLSLYTDSDALFKVDSENAKKYGKIFCYFLGDEPSLVITDLEILRRIFFEESGKTFTERSQPFLETTISHGVLFAKYPRWKVLRKIMSQPFSRYAIRGQTSTEFVEVTVNLMLDYINHRISENTKKKVVLDIQNVMQSTALHLISAMAIKLPGVQVKEHDENVASLDKYLALSNSEIIRMAIRFPFLKRVLAFMAKYSERNRTIATIYSELNRIIDESLNKISKSSETTENLQVIDTLIKMHHEGKMSREEVLGSAEALLIAGYDTTSTTLAYLFWVLAKKPHIQDRLRGELIAHGVDAKYLMQVINETMRLYPTVISFTTRLATQTVKINDQLTIPQGTRVIYNSWLIHRDETIWKNAEEFDADRFEDETKIDPCAFAPFGLGDRKCLGYQLALLEMKTIVCEILLHYKLNLVSPAELELVSRANVLTKSKEKILIELEKL